MESPYTSSDRGLTPGGLSPPSSSNARAPDEPSPFAMWAGNIPGDATMAEAITLFNKMDNAPTIIASNMVSSSSLASTTSSITSGVLSVFLMPQSHCAFVNYVDDEHLQRALKFFHGRPFRPKSAKMVCRIRDERSRRSGPSAQRKQKIHRQWVKTYTGNVVSMTSSASSKLFTSRTDVLTAAHEGVNPSEAAEDDLYASDGSTASTTSSLFTRYFPDRYFILKAMTQGDIQLSIGTRYWATQMQNEEVLNRAYRTSQNVWLIFGANKSGQFSGFARMTSPILSGGENDLEWRPRESQLPPITQPSRPASSVRQPGPQESLPATKPTENPPISTALATAHTQETITPPSASSSHSQTPVPTPQSNPDQRWTASFKVQWIRTDPLPFYQLRNLKNPWNRGLEVKISRDGTECEPTVGKQLLKMWNQVEGSPFSPYPPPPNLHQGGGFGPLA